MDHRVTDTHLSAAKAPGHAAGAGFLHSSIIGLLLVTWTLVIAAFLAASCSGSDGDGQPGSDGSQGSSGSDSAGQSASAGGKRSSDAGSVTVDLNWDGPDSGLVFSVTMDTHSVDLDGFDLIKLAVLRTDSGAEIAPTGWDAPKGGHHREGKLSFPATLDGRPVLGETVRGITIIVRDVASPERSFQWAW